MSDNNYGAFGCGQLLYLTFGTQQVVERRCQNLQDRLELYLDGVKQDLPEIESVVVLNIPSWGAGVDLWTLLKLGKQTVVADKVSLYSLFTRYNFFTSSFKLSLHF